MASNVISQSQATTASLPLLPEDIEREIFETAARLHVGCGPRLVLVARKVQLWVTPLIYEVLIAKTRVLIATPGDEEVGRYGTYVRHLLLGNETTPQDLLCYVSACPNTVDLAMWTSNTSPELLPFLAKMPLLRLSVNVRELFGSPQKFSDACRDAHPALVNLTHLDLITAEGPWEGWTGLTHLRKLTHFSASAAIPNKKLVGWVLENCPQLRVLMLVSEHGIGRGVPSARVSRMGNHQLAVCEVSSYIWDWKAGARGERDVWDYAEEVLGVTGI